MVFSKLSAQEKDAFFGLLDEYFRSRPELLGTGGSGQGPSAATAAATAGLGLAAARAIVTSNHTDPSSAPPIHKLTNNNPYRSMLGGGRNEDKDDGSIGTGVGAGSGVAQAAATSLGRVAAASLAFSGGGGGGGGSPNPNTSSSPTLPRRVPGAPSVTGSVSAPTPAAVPGAEVDKLVTKKTGVLNAFKKAPVSTSSVVIPSAFSAPRNTFGPPPVRRAASATGGGGGAGVTAASAGLRSVPPPPQSSAPEGEAEGEEYAEGEWAEVLYDYSSEDPGDLTIEAGSRVFVTDKSSEDWWTGQIEGQGREGLFPASYVKLL